MLIKNLIEEDFVNYKKPSMVVLFPNCSFKCDKECGHPVCQNGELAHSKNIEISYAKIIQKYINNPITEAMIFSGLEPFDSFEDMLNLIIGYRQTTNDDLIIYTGYTEKEIENKINILKHYKNIIVKFGRFIPNQESHYDELLGINLASPNQYSRRIS